MAVKFLGIFKELKNISNWSHGSSKKNSRSIEEPGDIISSLNLTNNKRDNDLTMSSGDTIRNAKFSTSSSIDSANSASSMESGHMDSTKKKSRFDKEKTSHKPSSSSSGYSTIKSKDELVAYETYENEYDLGTSENLHVKLTDFDFLNLIGNGSYGKVLMARHKKEHKVYAVKVLQKKMIIKYNKKNHIMRERDVLLKNLNHPFLVDLHYAFQTRDKLYFVLEYVNGGELYFHLQKDKRFSEARARFYAAEITSALGYLHRNCIVYRDLKPENCLLDSEGHIVLTDFGLSKNHLQKDDTTNTFCGTVDYLSPEILRKEDYGWAVDWWCLGVVLYEFIHGLPPFFSHSGNQRETFYNILHKQVKINSETSIAARDIIFGLLQKEKENRLGILNDAEEIMSHDFFRSINWTDLENRKIKPPFNPNVKNIMDLRNISTEFTHQPIPQSLCRSSSNDPSSIPFDAFQGFSYAPSNLNYR